MKYRITHPDKYNWCVEGYDEGGTAITRGRYVGQTKKAKWTVIGYHSSLQHAAKALLDDAAGDSIEAEEATSLLHAIELAEARVMAALATLGEPVTEAAVEAEDDAESTE